MPGDWLVYGNTSEPSTLNCAQAKETIGRLICRLTSDTLIDFDQSFHFIPRLAESYDLSPDGLTLVFHLRKGVRWHDGIAFSARDVLDTVETIRHLDPNGETYRGYFGPMIDVTSPDDLTIKARYSERFSGALAGWRETFIMPAHVPHPPGAASALDRAPVGTGPFKFAGWAAQQQIVLEANKEYFGGRPMVDRFIYRIVPNAEALRAAAETGELDVAPLTTDWAAAHSPPDPKLPFRVLIYPVHYVDMIYWNIEEPRGLFKDPRVRRALTMLMDRDGYVSKVQHGLFRPATTLIDPLLWGGDPALKPYPFDPNEAARLLDEAGVKDRDGDGVRDLATGPMSFTLIYSNGAPEFREVAAMLERTAAAVGVQVRLQGLEWAVMRPKIYSHQFEAAVYRRQLEPFPDPYAYFHSSQTSGGLNFGSYRSEDYNRLSEELRRTSDPKRSAEILSELQLILHRDQPCTFIAIPQAVMAIHRRFQIPPVTASGLWNWYPSILNWWVPPAERKHS